MISLSIHSQSQSTAEILQPTLRTCTNYSTFQFVKHMNSTEQSPWQADSRSTGQDIHRLFRKSKVHYRAHKRWALDHIPSQMNEVHTLAHYYLRYTLILSSHVCLRLRYCLFLLGRGLLGCDSVQCYSGIPTLRKTMLPPSSG
jgi:hypothetical protein